jgi:ATP-dependent RNA helicase DDX21
LYIWLDTCQVHRSGRTGRAGRKGICVTLFGPRDKWHLEKIEAITKNSFEWLGAPNPKSLLKTAAETAATDAAAIEADVAALFSAAAGRLLEAKGGDATEAVAAALALATGTTAAPVSRSLLSNLDGCAAAALARLGGRIGASARIGLVAAAPCPPHLPNVAGT